MTDEEIAAIAAKHRMAKFPNLALTRERLSRKAKAEPKFRFYTLLLSNIYLHWFETIASHTAKAMGQAMTMRGRP
jgi:hypothetical protein